VTAAFVQLFQEFPALAVRETNRIIFKVTPRIHVIDVVPIILSASVPRRVAAGTIVFDLPNVLKRNLKLFKVCYDLLYHRPIRVTPAALVVAKGEVLLHSR
jgi:hypothetical protein